MGVSDLGDPSLVVVFLGLDLALTNGVPDSKILEGTSGDDESVIVGEGNGVDFLFSG